MTSEEIAILALGSFWEPEDFFARLHGVVLTDVGYTGGTSGHPTFHDISDHCEAIRITFDPHIISYQEILKSFWKLHDPTADYEPQYRSAIFYLDEHQHTVARDSKADCQLHYDEPILTTIEPATKFYEAEEYHQHYLAKLRGELR
ncbi:MAG TPA: peptide-methionine (S)-S-oxide reductase MsrA [Candidatus Saccharimonadales bacterium]|jgi:methionine-S-sulfoxide reductase|nr:peptide-methionine (S)-S-oxide reductase MsrA [Candidatus Saccharimonadales bacterium]